MSSDDRSCFFFQAEDGIRDDLVTGVQTCALPISAATLNGTVNPNGLAPTTYFQWGGTTNYGSFTATNPWPPVNLTVSVTLSGLVPASTHHFRLVASTSAGTTLGGDMSFTNPISPTTLAASGITTASA